MATRKKGLSSIKNTEDEEKLDKWCADYYSTHGKGCTIDTLKASTGKQFCGTYNGNSLAGKLRNAWPRLSGERESKKPKHDVLTNQARLGSHVGGTITPPREKMDNGKSFLFFFYSFLLQLTISLLYR